MVVIESNRVNEAVELNEVPGWAARLLGPSEPAGGRGAAAEGLRRNVCYYDPVDGVAVVPRIEEPWPSEISLYRISLDSIERHLAAHPVSDGGAEFLDELVDRLCDDGVHVELPEYASADPVVANVAGLIDSDPRWVEAVGLRGDFVARCRDVLRAHDSAGSTRYVPCEIDVDEIVAGPGSAGWNTRWNPAAGIALGWEESEGGIDVLVWRGVGEGVVGALDEGAHRVEESWQDRIFSLPGWASRTVSEEVLPAAALRSPGSRPASLLRGLAALPGWVECRTLEDGDEEFRRAMGRREAVAFSSARRLGRDREPKPEMEAYLEACLAQYGTATGWKGLGAEQGIETFVRFIGSGECTVPAPRGGREVLEVETPVGTLVAGFRGDPGTYDGIGVDLFKPDGTSGQVAVVEVVSPSCEEAPLHPTPLHTFCWDGDHEEFVAEVDCNPGGEFMQDVDWVPGEWVPGGAGRGVGDDPSIRAEAAQDAAMRGGRRDCGGPAARPVI